MEGTLSIDEYVYCLREGEDQNEILIFLRKILRNKLFPNLEIHLTNVDFFK